MSIVTPSYLSTTRMGIVRDTGNQTNTSLRIGEVKEIVYPTSKKSISKKYIEYTVDVPHQDGNGPRTSTTYSGCIVDTKFGTGGDSLRYTLRPDTQTDYTKGRAAGVGSKVLLQCINGSNTQAVIMGGVRDPTTGDNGADDSEEAGHNLRFQFNGIHSVIDKGGAFTLTRTGPSNANGTTKDSVDLNDTGASLEMDANGSTIITGGFGTISQQSITLNNRTNHIDILAASAFNSEAPDGHTLFSRNGPITLEDEGTYIGSANANEALVMGTTYRSKESALHLKLVQNLTVITGQLAALGIAHTAAAVAIGAAGGANAVPMVGPVVAAPLFVIAATSIGSMTAMLTMMASAVSQMLFAINDFELSAPDYLSVKNFADHG